MFLSKWEALNHSIWISDVKVIKFLVLRTNQASSQKKTFSFTLNANILQSVWLNITKILAHDQCRTRSYSLIVIFFSDFLGDSNKMALGLDFVNNLLDSNLFVAQACIA